MTMESGVQAAVGAAGQMLRWLTDARRFENATRDALGAQRDKLRSIIGRNRDTEYGRAHGFGSIRSVADFQRQVPINSYDTLGPYIERMSRGERNLLTADDPIMFAVTSGTTGKAKLIPVTPSYLAEYTHSVQVHTWRVVEDYGTSVSGQFLVTSSCDVEGHTPAGIPYGALSGFVIKRQPAMVRSHFVLPYEVALIKDVELKYYVTLRLAVEAPMVAISSLNPSSVLMLCDKLQLHAERLIDEVRAGTASAMGDLPPAIDRALKPRLAPNLRRADELAAIHREHGELPPRVVWPKLMGLTCWKGGTMPLYSRQLRRWFGDLPIRDRGYMASEGIGSIPLVNAGAAGALAVTTHFFEFIPVDRREEPDPPVLTCDQLQPNCDYYILFTTSAGLYRYDINDIIRVVDFYHDDPVIEFVRKGRGITSLTGEKLAEPQVTAAMMAAVDQLGLDQAVRHFTAVPQFGNPPRYSVLLEPMGALDRERARALIAALDRELKEQNVEYETKRNDQRLGPPLLRLVAAGSYDRYRQRRVADGAPEAQVKVPHLTPDQAFGRDFTVVEEVEE
jgi:hypothetical protein